MTWNNPITLNNIEVSVNIVVLLHEAFHIMGMGLGWNKKKVSDLDNTLNLLNNSECKCCNIHNKNKLLGLASLEKNVAQYNDLNLV